MDSWCFVVGLVSSSDGTMVHIPADIISFLKVELSNDVVSSLLGESVWLVAIGKSCNILLTSLDNTEGDDRKIWSTDASTDRLSFSLSSSSWLVKSTTYVKWNYIRML